MAGADDVAGGVPADADEAGSVVPAAFAGAGGASAGVVLAGVA